MSRVDCYRRCQYSASHRRLLTKQWLSQEQSVWTQQTGRRLASTATMATTSATVDSLSQPSGSELPSEAKPVRVAPPPLPFIVSCVPYNRFEQSLDSEQSERSSTVNKRVWGPLTPARLAELSSRAEEVAQKVHVFNNFEDACEVEDEGFDAEYVCSLDTAEQLTQAGFQKVGDRFQIYTRPANVLRPSDASAAVYGSAVKSSSAQQPSDDGNKKKRQRQVEFTGARLIRRPVVVDRLLLTHLLPADRHAEPARATC